MGEDENKIYDTVVHIGSQMENYLQGYAAGDIAQLERALENLKDIIASTKKIDTIKNIREYEREKEKQIKNKANNAIKDIKTAIETKKGIDAIIIIGTILNNLEGEITTINIKFFEHVRGYLLAWIQGDE